MHIIQQYERLASEKRWNEALPIIREIVERDPSIGTSWFNLGVCLDEIGQHSEAAEAFIKAQESAIHDVGICYRIFRSFYLANDFPGFLEFANYMHSLDREIIDTLVGDGDFSDFTSKDEFKALNIQRK